jgi:diguanylate cyclase (GGDEF)-like protein
MMPEELIARGRILIVDDEHANVRLLERLLLSAGFGEVRSITDPCAVLSVCDEFQPDIILLDLHMPRMDGYAVLQAVRAKAAPGTFLPILVLTADTTREAMERALSNGANDFLTKPFERTEVFLRTRNLLHTRFLHLALKDENRVLEARLVHQAFHDSLTGLANRALFRDRVEHALTRCSRGGRVAMLLFDLDNFKSVNDTVGHLEGDMLLTAVADRLRRATRGCDTVARIGGDEFAVLLDGIQSDEDAMCVLERVAEAMRLPISLQGHEFTVGASVGVAFSDGVEQVEELLRNADVAMYSAKDNGKGRHAVFHPGMYTALLERLELEADLRQAVERGQLKVFYQPIVELETGALTSVEALLRWHHPDRDVGSTAGFISIAEQTGLIVPIGRWVLAEACRQGRRWQLEAANGETPTISVNVSARQLQEPAFAHDVATILAETGFPAERLILEITESALMANMTVVVDRLHELKALGLRLAIDDFGTGYCNLTYLQQFPLDILKIDKSFVTSMAEIGGDAMLASTIVGLATTMKLHTIAEGVERADQRSQLLALGCSHGQGFLFAKAVDADTVSGYFKHGCGLEGGGTDPGMMAIESAG